jgi:uncharacterized protein YjbI with pentapeptide repeats
MPWFIVAGAIALFVIACLLWWWLPKWQMRYVTTGDPKARADIEDNFRKTITQLLGGAAVLLGAAAAYYGTLQTLQVNKDQAQRSEQAARGLLFSNQVSKGFEQLGNKDSIVVRLGGIYALEGVMNISEQYHRPILEALCAFVRDGTNTRKGTDPPATDIQAALTVIGRRTVTVEREPSYFDEFPVDLQYVHIPRANLQNAGLANADLQYADLSHALLADAELNHAMLGSATLVNAVLLDARLENAFMAQAKLNGALLAQASLINSTLEEADLTGAGLMDANLSGSYLAGARLIGANLTGANLSGANLTGADLTKAHVTELQLQKACGTNAKLDPGLTLKPCAK